MITASHNPSAFNGYKVKAHFGGSATPAITATIEQAVEKEFRDGGKIPNREFFLRPEIPIATVAPEQFYFDHIKSLLDWDRIAKSKLKIVVDSMHGCGGRSLEELLRDTSCSVQSIRVNPAP